MRNPTLTLALNSEKVGSSPETFVVVVIHLDTRGAVYNIPRSAAVTDWYSRETIRSVQRHNTRVIERVTRRR
jgi:hypothetical protein